MSHHKFPGDTLKQKQWGQLSLSPIDRQVNYSAMIVADLCAAARCASIT
jgi:hypothetical protein